MHGRSRTVGILRAQARLRRAGSGNSVLRRQSIDAGNPKWAAGSDTLLAGARLVVGKVSPFIKSSRRFYFLQIIRGQLTDN